MRLGVCWWRVMAGLLGLLISVCSGLIHNLDVVQDVRDAFLIESFGFREGGRLNLTVTGFSIYSKEAPYRAGFVVVNTPNEGMVGELLEYAEEEGGCLLDEVGEKGRIPGGQVVDLSEPSEWSEKTFGKVVGPGECGLYSLLFVRCMPAHPTQASFHLAAAFANPGPNYLGAGQMPLPRLYIAFSFAFLLTLVLWLRLVRKCREEHSVRGIHHLMSVLLLFKFITLLTEGVRYHYLSMGGGGQAWSFFFYVFSFLKGTMLFIVIMLIGTGWSLLRPALSQVEKRALALLLLLQILDNVAMVVTEQSAPGNFLWLAWHDVLHVVDFICWLAILVPIMRSIRSLKSTVEANDGKAVEALQRLNRFRQLYMLVFAYIYFTRIIVFLLSATLPYNISWLEQLFTEGATLGFYVAIGYKFRPQADFARERRAANLGRNRDGDDDEGTELIDREGV